MPSVSIGVEADAATWSSGIAAGAGNHLPVGYYGSAKYRSAMRFIPPAWSAWTAISKATLTIYISDFQHVGPRNSSIVCRRMSTANLWTKAAGTQNCESGFSGSNTTQYADLVGYSTNQVQFSSGTTANKAITLDVTDLVNYYWSQNASRIGFIFDPVGTSDYTELWSDEKAGYDASLAITYVVQSPPVAPTLTAPAAGATVGTQTPTFSWTHSDPQGDAQANAQVRVWNAAGTTQVGATQTVVGSAASLVWPTALTRGTSYMFDVATADAANGYGPFSAKQAFTVKALPVVTIDATRRMVFNNNAPRLQVNWSADQPQGRYRVQVASPVFDSGWLSGAATSYVLATQPVVDNVAQSITVSVENTDASPLQGSTTRSFTPRYGLTVHRRDLGTAPVNWGNPLIVSTVPTGASLVIQYGSSATATATPSPNTWYSTLTGAPKARYVFWRAWFIPSATAGPTLDRIDIVSDSTVVLVDKWGSTKNAPGLVAPWSIDPYEYVYGTRSISADVNGAGPWLIYSYGIKVLAGRSYILTGLMKTVGNAGAVIRLQDGANATMTSPTGALISIGAPADTDWFTPDQRDVNRYKTPVWVAPNDMTVYIALRVGGTAGSKAWFDAIKLEESTVATPWSPGAVGATIVDAGGVQIDGAGGGIFRYRGSAGGGRDLVSGGPDGLLFGPTTQLYDNGSGDLALNRSDGNNIFRIQGTAGEAVGVYSALLVNRGGDTTARMVAGYAGDVQQTGIFVGPGNAARDTALWRSAANEWTTDDSLKVQGLINQPPVVRVYTGAATWTKPAATTGFSHAIVEVQAGGGGGSGTPATGAGVAASGGDGAGGGYCRKLWAATALPATVAVTVGAGGTAAAGAAGGTGGTSSFIGTGVNQTANGGGGGSLGTAVATVAVGAGGNGGTASGGDINVTGGDGSHGIAINGANPVPMGTGGGSPLGTGASPGASVAGGNNGAAGHAYGGGGSRGTAGASVVARSGGAGGAGVVIVTEFYAS